MNDHIRLVHFNFKGKPEQLGPYLRLDCTFFAKWRNCYKMCLHLYSTLLELYTFEPFVNQMNPKKELNVQLQKCIEPSVESWFSMLMQTVMPTGGVRSIDTCKLICPSNLYYIVRTKATERPVCALSAVEWKGNEANESTFHIHTVSKHKAINIWLFNCWNTFLV